MATEGSWEGRGVRSLAGLSGVELLDPILDTNKQLPDICISTVISCSLPDSSSKRDPKATTPLLCPTGGGEDSSQVFTSALTSSAGRAVLPFTGKAWRCSQPGRGEARLMEDDGLSLPGGGTATQGKQPQLRPASTHEQRANLCPLISGTESPFPLPL